MFTTPRLNAPTRPVSRPPTSIGTSWPLVQSDLAAVEQDGRVTATAAKPTRAAEGKQPPVLEEELPLLGKEQA